MDQTFAELPTKVQEAYEQGQTPIFVAVHPDKQPYWELPDGTEIPHQEE